MSMTFPPFPGRLNQIFGLDSGARKHNNSCSTHIESTLCVNLTVTPNSNLEDLRAVRDLSTEALGFF